jgi:hypothetical protein
MTRSIMTPSINDAQNNDLCILSGIYAELKSRYAERECLFAECLYVEYIYAE